MSTDTVTRSTDECMLTVEKTTWSLLSWPRHNRRRNSWGTWRRVPPLTSYPVPTTPTSSRCARAYFTIHSFIVYITDYRAVNGNAPSHHIGPSGRNVKEWKDICTYTQTKLVCWNNSASRGGTRGRVTVIAAPDVHWWITTYVCWQLKTVYSSFLCLQWSPTKMWSLRKCV